MVFKANKPHLTPH